MLDSRLVCISVYIIGVLTAICVYVFQLCSRVDRLCNMLVQERKEREEREGFEQIEEVEIE